MFKNNLKTIIAAAATLIIGLVAGFGTKIIIDPVKETVTVQSDFQMELSDEQVPTLIETAEGTIETISAPTVESVESDQLVDECPEGEEDCGKGKYVYAPTVSPTAFKDYVYGNCWNTDDAYGAQCWDLGDLFWQNYAGRRLSTCGTGAAKGIWDCKEQNAGEQFTLITDTHSLQAGDWIIFGNGTYGHVGMALGGYNNGYIALLGQNQGGTYCQGGGSSANIINISLASFRGAFRPKTYTKPEPVPQPEPLSTCERITLVAGDTLGKIMQRCEGKTEWGKAMDEYAQSWVSEQYVNGQTVYTGWYETLNGVGLYAGDTIVRRKND